MQVETQLINIFVNGEPKQVPVGQTVTTLLDWLKLPSERVAVELNRTLVRKRDWDQTTIPADARIEIVEFVGGG